MERASLALLRSELLKLAPQQSARRAVKHRASRNIEFFEALGAWATLAGCSSRVANWRLSPSGVPYSALREGLDLAWSIAD